MGTYKWNNSNSTPNLTSENKEKNTKNICRIFVDPDVKKTIILDELSMSYDKDNNSFSNSQNNQLNMAGINYPVICINDIFIGVNEIALMEIDCTNFLPTISLKITPIGDGLLTKGAIKDGDIISLFFRTTSDVITPIRCDFIINSNRVNGYEVNNPLSSPSINLNGELFIPGIHSSKDNIFTCGTSKSAIKDVCKKLGIGFAFNDIDETNDKQLWFSPKKKVVEYINDIIEHSWKDEQSFFKCWIDLYYNLNFINVNKMLISDDDVDMTIGTLIRDMQDLSPVDTSEKNAKISTKVLTNNYNFKQTPFFIFDIIPFNNSSKITTEYGSKINNEMFIHNQNLYNQGDNPYITLENIQMYDPKKVDNYMILRGRTKYNKETSLENDMSRANINTDDINTHTVWRGIQYTISDDDKDTSINEWSGNVNLNYNRAVSHNKINNVELDKMYIKVKVASPCLQIMRGEKVPVILHYKDEMSSFSTNNKDKKLSDINKLYSGYYFVDGYKIVYKQNSSKDNLFTNFYTEFTLKRREWPVPVDYQKE